jgi:hypothetical protein
VPADQVLAEQDPSAQPNGGQPLPARRGTWATYPTGRSWRDGAGLLAKDGGLYLLGGWSSGLGTNSEVWFTSDLVT